MLKYTIFISFYFLLCISSHADVFDLFRLDDKKSGTTSLPFLKIPVGARTIGMGSNLGSIDYQPTVLSHNPAGLSRIDDYWSTISHSEILNEFRHEYVATTIPTKKFGTFGFSANILFAKPIENSADINENSYKFTSSDYSISLGYGTYVVPDVFAMGIKSSYLYSTIDKVNGNSYSFDLGFLWNLKFGLYSSFSINHISPGIQYQGSTVTNELPLTLRVSIGKPIDNTSFSWTAGYTKSIDGISDFDFGAEQALFDQSFSIRGGYVFKLNDNEQNLFSGISLGVGAVINSLNLDYGFKYLGGLGSYHSFTMNFSQIKNIFKKELSWFEKAQISFKQRNCAEATYYARKALKEKPGDLQVMSIIQSCDKMAMESEGNFMTLILTGNTWGKVNTQWENEIPLGGLAKRNSLFKQLRRQSPKNITISTGNIFPDHYNESFALDKFLNVYERLLYDFIYRTESDEVYLNKAKSNAENLNWLTSTTKNYKNYIREVGEKDVLILPLKKQGIMNMVKEYNAIRSTWKSRPDFVVCVMESNLKDAQFLASSAAHIDLILLASKNNYSMPKPISFNNTHILALPKNGTYVGKYSVYFSKNSDKVSRNYELLPLTTSVPSDSSILEVIGNFDLDNNSHINHKIIPEAKSKNFIFLKGSDDKYDFFLNNTRDEFFYRLSSTPDEYQSIALASQRSQVVFINSKKQLFMQKSTSKTSQRLSSESEIVAQVMWDPFQNYLLYLAKENGIDNLIKLNPFGYETSNLTQNKFDNIKSFTISPNSKFISLVHFSSGVHQVVHSNNSFLKSVTLSPKHLQSYQPLYSPSGNKLAFIVESQNGNNVFKDLYFYDFKQDSLFRITQEAKVHDFVWNSDGEKIIYNDGENILDLNIYSFRDKKIGKLTDNFFQGSEIKPRLFYHKKEEGILFELNSSNASKIYWHSLESNSFQEFIPNKKDLHLP